MAPNQRNFTGFHPSRVTNCTTHGKSQTGVRGVTYVVRFAEHTHGRIVHTDTEAVTPHGIVYHYFSSRSIAEFDALDFGLTVNRRVCAGDVTTCTVSTYSNFGGIDVVRVTAFFHALFHETNASGQILNTFVSCVDDTLFTGINSSSSRVPTHAIGHRSNYVTTFCQRHTESHSGAVVFVTHGAVVRVTRQERSCVCKDDQRTVACAILGFVDVCGERYESITWCHRHGTSECRRSGEHGVVVTVSHIFCKLDLVGSQYFIHIFDLGESI